MTSQGTASIATLSVDGDTTIAGTLVVAEDVLFSKDLHLNDQLISSAPASLGGAVAVNGPLLVSGAATLKDTNIAGAFSVPDAYDVSGALSIGSTLTVSQSGQAQVGGSLSTTGPVVLSGLTVNDTVTLSSSAAALQALGVDGPSTLQAVSLDGALSVAGSASFADEVDVTGGVSVGGSVGLGGAAVIDGALSVGQGTTLSDSLQVGLGADVTGDLSVTQNSRYKDNLVVDGDLLVHGAMRTRHREEVFLGDSHIILNSGAVAAGALSSGFASVYSVDQVLCSDALVGFLGATGNASGRFSIQGLSAAAVTQNDGRIVSVTGGSPYDGLYLLDGSDGAAPRLYSTDSSAVDWTLRMPFLNAVTWGPSGGGGGSVSDRLIAEDVQAAGVSVAIVKVSHFLADSTGAVWFARGGSRSDFWSQQGNTSYTRLSVDGGDTSFAQLTASGVLDKATTSLTTGGIVAYLSSDDELGVTRKIINNSGASCTISAPQGQNIDGLPSFTLQNNESITLTKFDGNKYAGWFAASSTGSAYVSIFGYGRFTYKLLDDPSTSLDAANVLLNAPTVAATTAFLYRSVAGGLYFSTNVSPSAKGGLFSKINTYGSTIGALDIPYTDLAHGGFFEYVSLNPNHLSSMQILMNTATVGASTHYLCLGGNFHNKLSTSGASYSSDGFLFSFVSSSWTSSPSGNSFATNQSHDVYLVAGIAFRTAWTEAGSGVYRSTETAISSTKYLYPLNGYWISSDGLNFSQVNAATGQYDPAVTVPKDDIFTFRAVTSVVGLPGEQTFRVVASDPSTESSLGAAYHFAYNSATSTYFAFPVAAGTDTAARRQNNTSYLPFYTSQNELNWSSNLSLQSISNVGGLSLNAMQFSTVVVANGVIVVGLHSSAWDDQPNLAFIRSLDNGQTWSLVETGHHPYHSVAALVAGQGAEPHHRMNLLMVNNTFFIVRQRINSFDIFKSSDAVNWTVSLKNYNGTEVLPRYDLEGLNWTHQQYVRDVYLSYGNGTYVYVLYSNNQLASVQSQYNTSHSEGFRYILTSPDASTWTWRPLKEFLAFGTENAHQIYPVYSLVTPCVYANGTWIMRFSVGGGISGPGLRSTDLVNWTAVTTQLPGVEYTDIVQGQLVVVSDLFVQVNSVRFWWDNVWFYAHYFSVSADGISWTWLGGFPHGIEHLGGGTAPAGPQVRRIVSRQILKLFLLNGQAWTDQALKSSFPDADFAEGGYLTLG